MVKFFKVGINEEGYLNYNQMALQIEDVYDVLSMKLHVDNDSHGNADVLLMMEQASGHV